jgi:hypothetical protein
MPECGDNPGRTLDNAHAARRALIKARYAVNICPNYLDPYSFAVFAEAYTNTNLTGSALDDRLWVLIDEVDKIVRPFGGDCSLSFIDDRQHEAWGETHRGPG